MFSRGDLHNADLALKFPAIRTAIGDLALRPLSTLARPSSKSASLSYGKKYTPTTSMSFHFAMTKLSFVSTKMTGEGDSVCLRVTVTELSWEPIHCGFPGGTLFGSAITANPIFRSAMHCSSSCCACRTRHKFICNNLSQLGRVNFTSRPSAPLVLVDFLGSLRGGINSTSTSVASPSNPGHTGTGTNDTSFEPLAPHHYKCTPCPCVLHARLCFMFVKLIPTSKIKKKKSSGCPVLEFSVDFRKSSVV